MTETEEQAAGRVEKIARLMHEECRRIAPTAGIRPFSPWRTLKPAMKELYRHVARAVIAALEGEAP